MLYASKNPHLESFKEFALEENVNRLTEEEKLPCEGPITKEEGKIALAGMAETKQPVFLVSRPNSLLLFGRRWVI